MKDHKPTRKAWRMGSCLLAILLSLSLYLPFTAKQAKAADTTYTVRLSTGRKGNFSGKGINEMKVKSGLKYGDTFDLSSFGKVNVTDSKYYMKGYKESGKDNNTVFPSDYKLTITRDIDYVVAYGIAGSDVEYYVNYVDENGRKLRDSKTYTGNVGDKPVVAYEYIENYFPQARNLTKTLSEKASDNNFTFVYRRVGSSETATTEEEDETDETEDNETTVTNDNDDDDNDRTTTGGNNTTGGGGTTDGGGGTGGDDDTEPTARTAAPAADTGLADLQDMPDNPDEVPELVDIDDQETPLADFEGSTSDESEETTESEKPKSGLTTPAKIGIGIACAAAVIAAAGALYYFIIYRGYEYEDEDDEDEDEEGEEGDDSKE